MARERTNSDPRFKEIKEILQKERPRDFETIFNEIIEKLSKLVDDNNREPLFKYLEENQTIGNVLSIERIELGQDSRRNPKTIMSYMREIFEEYRKSKNSNN